MQKVIHIINSLDKGGAEMMLFKLLKSSKSNVFENTVICLKSAGVMSSFFKNNNINVIML